MADNKILEKTRESLEDAIKPIIKKGEAMTPADLECLTKAVCIIEKIKNIEADYYFDDDGYSYRRGRSPVTGRFVSRDADYQHDDSASNTFLAGTNSRRYYDANHAHNGYSGHSRNDMTIYHIESLIDAAPSEQERQFLSEWLRRTKNS